MKKLIVNADDFGLTQGVCAGITKSYNEGIIRSATVMINIPDIEKKIQDLKFCKDIGVGLHLNVTYGVPVSGPEEVKSLLSENGSFWRTPNLVISHAKTEDVEKEWAAQIEKCLRLGLKIGHIDTHHHTHIKEPLTPVYLKLAKKYNLAARTNDEAMAHRFRKEGVKTTDYFVQDFYGDKVSKENFISIINNLQDGSTEICSHPALIDEELVKVSSYVTERLEELKTYTDAGIIKLISEENIELINFTKL